VTEVGECAVNNGACNPLANCTNLSGMYTCICVGGYFGDGFRCAGLPYLTCKLIV